MKGRKRNSNIKILQRQIQDLAIDKDIKIKSDVEDIKGSGIEPNIVKLVEKVKKKKGIPKDSLINTKRLLTM